MNSTTFVSSNADTLTAAEYNLNMGGVAVDILPDAACANCAGLELVIGAKIYSVNINMADTTAVVNLESDAGFLPVFYDRSVELQPYRDISCRL